MDISRVRNEAVWNQVKIVLIASGLLFLVNIYFGFANTITDGEIPRQQVLIHLHAGSIGWITLSAIGLAVWVVTNQRDVGPSYERGVRILTWAAVLIFALYIPNFWLAFLPGDVAITTFLPIFGSAAVLVLWSAAIFTIVQLWRQSPLTNVQLLVAGGLLVASIGASVGALLGLERVIGSFLPMAGEDRTGAHAGAMDTYLFLVAAGIIEWFIRPANAQRWSWAGVVQAAAWTIGAAMVPVAFLLNAVPILLPVYGIALLMGLIVFAIRIAWRPLLAGPLARGVRPWAFFGTLWLAVFMGLFLFAVGTGDFDALPDWFGAAFVHAGFVGMMTNLLLGVHSAGSQESASTLRWAEPLAMWTINLGLLAFIGLEVTVGIRAGAALMGIGVLIGVMTMQVRLWSSRSAEARAGIGQARTPHAGTPG